jgi:uncharacterized damage-inducible protein DinB
MYIKEWLLPEFDHEIGSTRRLLERLSDDVLGWKPHDKSRSAGALGTHIANIPTWTKTVLGTSSFDVAALAPGVATLPSCADLLCVFDESARKSRAIMDKTDAEYMAPWTLRRGEREVFSVPRLMAFRSFVLNHLIHHRGQLSVYLRLMNVPVPPIYGPSADDV